MFLVDASVWATLAAPDDEAYPAAAKLIDSAAPVGALDLTMFEVANAVGVKMGKPERSRRLFGFIVRRCHGELVNVDPELCEAAVDVAGELGLTAYDAAYVAAARRYGWQLVSLDVRDLVSKDLAVTPDAALYP